MYLKTGNTLNGIFKVAFPKQWTVPSSYVPVLLKPSTTIDLVFKIHIVDRYGVSHLSTVA